MTIDGVVDLRHGLVRVQMGDDLMAIEIEIDPGFGAAPLGATEQLAIEGARNSQVMDGERKMERAYELTRFGFARSAVG